MREAYSVREEIKKWLAELRWLVPALLVFEILRAASVASGSLWPLSLGVILVFKFGKRAAQACS